jgi:serine protease
VLDRLRVEGEIDSISGGVMKIDLTPEGASPTQLPTEGQPAGAADAPPAGVEAPAVEPAAIVEEGARCPAGVTTAQLEADIALKTQCALERLRASRQFEFVEKNYVITTAMDRIPGWTKPTTPPPATPPPAPGPAPAPAALTLPNDPLLPLQWSYRSRGPGAGEAPGGAGFERYWLASKQTGSRAVRVAVIDTGVDLTHPDYAGSPNLGPGVDLINKNERSGDGDGIDADPNDVGDACGPAGVNSVHGTHVAGTLGAAPTNKRRGVAGAAWNITVVPVRALGRCGGELEDVINAIRWSAGLGAATTAAGVEIVNPAPVDIINMSLSVPVACPASMQAAIDAAVARGSVVVVAAGNKARETRIFAPANCNNVLVVGAGDRGGAMSNYSNFGPEVDVLAPGGDMTNDIDADGLPDGILSTRTVRASCTDPVTRTPAALCHYSFLAGTSMAAPHVSAALALLKAQHNVSGKALEDLFFTRAVAPIDPTRCQIPCERNAGAAPVAGQAGVCMRGCGRGALDLARAAPQPAVAPAAGP